MGEADELDKVSMWRARACGGVHSHSSLGFKYVTVHLPDQLLPVVHDPIEPINPSIISSSHRHYPHSCYLYLRIRMRIHMPSCR